MHYLILTLEKAKNMEQKIVEDNLIISRAELKSLKSTIHPHFLLDMTLCEKNQTSSEDGRSE